MSHGSGPAAARRQTAWLFGLALLLRLVVAVVASDRFPPADDGSFYHVVAARIAAGDGYTWRWPDGAVTYAAHYPVGYPALVAAAYAVLGAKPLYAMLLNAVLGALLVGAVHACALRVTSLRRARWPALALALHPTLVLYAAALMTELAAAAVLLALTAYALFVRQAARPFWWRLPLALGGALLILIRPQLAPLTAVLGAIAVWLPPSSSGWAALGGRLRGASEVGLLALLLCLPWTLRNCQRMDGCVFVSANGGWNLLIGSMAEGRGSFVPIAGEAVPEECRQVFGEVGKDRCFGQAGLRRIAEQPARWLSLVPAKLGHLFNHGAVASAYLHASNPHSVTEPIRRGLATLETVYSRLLLLGACVGLLRATSTQLGRGVSLMAGLLALSPWGYLAQLAVLGRLLLARPSPGRRPLLFAATAVLGLTCLTHAVFFGAARYALLWLPWQALLLVLPWQNGSDPEPSRVF